MQQKIEELVKQAQQGNQEAFAEICRRFTPLVKKHAFQAHLKGIVEEAEGQAWLALVEAVQGYKADSQVPFAAFAESRVRYGVWNLFKKERRRWQQEWLPEAREEEGFQLEQVASAYDLAKDVEINSLLQEAAQGVKALPLRQQQVLYHTIICETSLTDTAAFLGVSVQAVHQLKKRSLTRLKTIAEGM